MNPAPPLAEVKSANEYRDMFQLHSRLAQDTFRLGDWPLCRLLLMNDVRFPWLILVPRQTQVNEISELAAKQQQLLMTEIIAAERVLRAAVPVDKINIGALGNVVPQLHVHVVARKHNDAAWPAPVWGHSTTIPYNKTQRERLMHKLQQAIDRITW